MSKHESKVSKRKYISNMIVAIIISLICGIALGFYLSKFISAQKNIQPPPIVQNPPIIEQPNVESPKDATNLTKDEQISAVKGVLKSYYDINTSILTKVVSDSASESKTSGKNQEEIFKDKLYKYYENIVAKDYLASMKTFIYGGNLKATYYSDFFRRQEASFVKTVNVTDYKDNTIKASVVINTPFKFYDKKIDMIPSSIDFFGLYKGKGITQTQYKKMLTLKPTQIDALKTYNGTITIENITGKWYITAYTWSIASTEITQVSIKEKAGEKTYTLSDFVKKYLTK